MPIFQSKRRSNKGFKLTANPLARLGSSLTLSMARTLCAVPSGAADKHPLFSPALRAGHQADTADSRPHEQARMDATADPQPPLCLEDKPWKT